MINDKTRRNIILSLVVLAVFVLVIMFSVMVKNIEAEKNKLFLDNIESCAQGISEYSKDPLFSKLYPVVKKQSEMAGVDVATNYHGVLRDGSCLTREYTNSDGVTSYATKAIVDIEELGFSYKIHFSWIKTNNQSIDLGFPEVSCLASDELIYGEFDCASNPTTTTETDDIFRVSPKFGDGWSISPTTSKTSKSGYGIILTYDPPSNVYTEGRFGKWSEEKTQEVYDYLQESGINIDNYEIIKKYAIVR